MKHTQILFSRILPVSLCLFIAGCGIQSSRPPDEPQAIPTPEVPEPSRSAPDASEPEPTFSFEVLPPEGLWAPKESEIAHVLHVNAGHPGQGSGTLGSVENPFKDIQSAVEAALRTGGPSEGVRILIAPGMYRETVDVDGWQREAPLILEGDRSADDAVILSGSDRFTEWTLVPNTDRVFKHDWPHRFGPQPNPWPGLMPMKEGESFRRELLFVNGRPYRQVYAPEALSEGCYLIDEGRGAVYFKPDADFPTPDPVIELSVRPQPKYGAHSKLIRVVNSRNIAIRNLTLQHAATVPFNSGALQVLGTENLLI